MVEGLHVYFQSRMLKDYQCRTCGQLTRCAQDSFIERPPPVIVLNLKRYDLFAPGLSKENKPIHNNLEIDFGKYIMQAGKVGG